MYNKYSNIFLDLMVYIIDLWGETKNVFQTKN